MIEQDFYDLYTSNSDILEDGFAGVINDSRTAAMDVLLRIGLPAKGDEKYRHSNISSLFEKDYEKYFVPLEGLVKCERAVPIEAHTIHLINGYVCGENKLMVLDNGVIYGSLREANKLYPDVIAGFFNALATSDKDAVAALNTVFTQDGFFLYVPDRVRLDIPIYIVNTYACEEDMLSYGRELMIFERDSSAQVIFDAVSQGDTDILANTVRESFVGRGARIDTADIQRVNAASKLLTNSYVSQDKDSHYTSVTVSLDGAYIRNNQNVKLNGAGSENHTYGIALGVDDQHIDNYTCIEHLVENCTSYENFKAVAGDSATVIFNGKIFVERDAQQTRAFQENRNLLLSDAARIYTKPELEIYADDVKCSHGATIGQLDSEAVFYMQQRGIGEDQARKLQLYGFINEIIGKINSEELSEYLDNVATQKIEKF